MITLYLVRHGETTFNLGGRIQGQGDAPLTDLGRRQAEAAAERLASERFAAVYSSDLGRARATAEVIAARHGLHVRQTPLLREASYGEIEGLTLANIEDRYPMELHQWRRDRSMRPPGAETREQVTDRCAAFLKMLLDKHEHGEKLLVVAHGGSIRGLVTSTFALPVTFQAMLHFSNAGLSILEAGDPPGLRLLNDTCHLDSLATAKEDAESAII